MTISHAIGIDIGTSSVKVALASSDGRTDQARSAPYPTSSPAPSHSEQNPDHWWAAVGDALGSLLRRHGEVFGANTTVALAGQMHTTVLRDRDGNLIRPAILWSDQRAAEFCLGAADLGVDIVRTTGNPLIPAFTLAHLLWLRRYESDALERTHIVLLPKDDIRQRLGAGHFTEPSDASGTALFDTHKGAWATELISLTGLDEGALPVVVESAAVTGHIMQLPPGPADLDRLLGAPVVGGAGDQAAVAVALEATAPDRLGLSLGTSGVALEALRTPRTGSFRHAIPDTWMALDSMHSAGLALTWWSSITGSSVADLLAALSDVKDPPSSVPIFLPFLQGHRSATGAPGAFIGLDRRHGREQLTQAILDGVALEMRRLALSVGGGRIADGVVHLGGGAGRSLTWQRTIAAVLDRPVLFTAHDSAHGAAMIAAQGAGWHWPSDLHPDVALVTAQPEAVVRYRAAIAQYEDLAKQLEAVSRP